MSKNLKKKLMELEVKEWPAPIPPIAKTVTYNNKKYSGLSFCHPEDTEFYSEKVGGTLAHYDALAKAAHDEYLECKNRYLVLNKAYLDICQTPKYTKEELDPTGRFQKSVWRAENDMKKAHDTYKALKNARRNYALAADKANNIIRRERANKANSNKES